MKKNSNKKHHWFYVVYNVVTLAYSLSIILSLILFFGSWNLIKKYIVVLKYSYGLYLVSLILKPWIIPPDFYLVSEKDRNECVFGLALFFLLYINFDIINLCEKIHVYKTSLLMTYVEEKTVTPNQ